MKRDFVPKQAVVRRNHHSLILALVLALVLLKTSNGRAQAWSGILDPSRAANWAQAGIPGGIPNRTTVCRTVSPSGRTDSTDMDAIDEAIKACAGTDEVVLLKPGKYTITHGLIFNGVSGVTLRGAGPNATKLVFTGTVACGESADVCIMGSSGWSENYPGSTTWTAGYSQGTAKITVQSASDLHVGQIIDLDQRQDAIGITRPPNGASESNGVITIRTTIAHGYRAGQCVGIGGVRVAGYDGWYTIAAVPSPTTFRYHLTCKGETAHTGLSASGGGAATVDTGGVYVSDVPGATSDEAGGVGRVCPDSNDPSCLPGEISQRNQMELKQITAISGNQITLDPPLELPNWRAPQAPGVWWTGNHAKLDGIESMTLDYTSDNGGQATGGIVFLNSYECWARSIRSIRGDRDHVWLKQSARIDIVDNYFFGQKSGGEMSYGVETYNGDSDDLVQNNICQHIVTCIMNGTDTGSVYAYNYAFDGGYKVANWLTPLISGNHDFSAYDLFEGNDAPAISIDDVHGTGTAITAFRNRLRGQDTPAKTNSLNSVVVSAFDRFANFAGNVLGTPDGQEVYQGEDATGSGYVWNVGAQAEDYDVPDDPLTVSSLLRWGNYDVVSDEVRWSLAEVPTAVFTFLGASSPPSTDVLPASFYLKARPAFWQTTWGTPPWPAIGPGVTGGGAPDGIGGHSYAIPAQLCSMHTPIDPAYQHAWGVKRATWSYGKATLTIGSNILVAHDTVTVSGINPSGYDGIFALTSRTASTVTYALPEDPGAYASGGTVTWPNVLLFNSAICYPSEL